MLKRLMALVFLALLVGFVATAALPVVKKKFLAGLPAQVPAVLAT